MTTAILPMLNLFFPSSIYVRQYFHVGAWVIGFMLLFLVGMNVVIPRFFCRVLCPLGAFLGTLSSVALWRIDRDPHKCVDCDLCLKNCEGASDPHTQLRKSECFVCFNCIEDCPEDAHLVQVRAAAPARNHRARRAGPARAFSARCRLRVFRLWPDLRRGGPRTTTKKSSARRVPWRKRIFSSAASSATNASASARRMCCSRRSWNPAWKASGRRSSTSRSVTAN